ncbi:hypothetical protein BJ138DRAFT_1129149 [Hygrophoropsis aurantiaca]|uniref:Uncharacterized protein n=1 Tax=Hygrophoropsis aurantiaca TaxID=72124 RepID=A0ACB8A2U1_9AGAM|nr:hypothetical protein BJ138DRAFT_1129149 [Hygrophoropsis aurantiaca]
MLSALRKRNESKIQEDIEAEQRKQARAQIERRVFGESRKIFTPEILGDGELWWRDHYQWLEGCGYSLRPRYHPNWSPSWKSDRERETSEDSVRPLRSHILDATRTLDGTYVTLKVIKKSVHPYEAEIGQYFSSEPVASAPANHCIPIYEVLQPPNDDDRLILIMPLLKSYSKPRFDTFGEVIECFRQLFEGLQFMHSHCVAHRDCMNLNTMMDARSLFIDAYHPQRQKIKRDLSGVARHYTRTQRPPKYYFIDFGLSRRYDPSNTNPLEDQIWGGDKTVPEFQKSPAPCNPFPTDIYYIGNLIREDFLQTKIGFEFIEPLISDMVHDDPGKRPTIDEVVVRFDEIRKGLSGWKLRSRVVDNEEGTFSKLIRGTGHWTRRVKFVAGRTPAVPTAS